MDYEKKGRFENKVKVLKRFKLFLGKLKGPFAIFDVHSQPLSSATSKRFETLRDFV